MSKNNIRKIRQEKGLSQEALGRLVGRDKFFVSRLENGATRLDIQTATAIAEALDVTIVEILGLPAHLNGSTGGFSDVATPFEPGDAHPLSAQTGSHRYAYKIDSDALENIGIRRGDEVIVDDSAAAVAAVKPLQAVLVNRRKDGGMSTCLPRQFVPPGLAITNSTNNHVPIVLGHDAYIFAVFVSVHRKL